MSEITLAECPVCFGVLNDCNDAQLTCQHPLCISCLTQLRNNDCPICRVKLSSSLPGINKYLTIITDEIVNDNFDDVSDDFDNLYIEKFTIKNIIRIMAIVILKIVLFCLTIKLISHLRR